MRLLCSTAIAIVLLASQAVAAPVDIPHARQVVKGWQRTDDRPLGSPVAGDITDVSAFKDEDGAVFYYVISIETGGFVVVGGDDEVEPIIGFASSGKYDPSVDTPLGALVSGDLAERVRRAREREAADEQGLVNAPMTDAPSTRAKWERLTAIGGGSTLAMGLSSCVSDECVNPLVVSRWSQGNSLVGPCFNYYTPPGEPGDSGNYVCGCVATAMAQVMRYFRYPTGSVGTSAFRVHIDGRPSTLSLRGGDGDGGPYDWSAMPLIPNWGSTPAERRAIGAICYDAGVAANMQYSRRSSGAYMTDCARAMDEVFQYNVAFNNVSGRDCNIRINPNLDAGRPVIISIDGPDGGHAVICDGYGYNNSTLYHHLNMGWAGAADAWYNLPDVDTPYADFHVVDTCVFNLYESGDGEIVSGRVTNIAGAPVEAATVTARQSSRAIRRTQTDTRGIYALEKLPSSQTFVLTVERDDCTFGSRTITTGSSSLGGTACGNVWGINFEGVQPSVALSSDLQSPQADGTVIRWTGHAQNFAEPEYQFRVSRDDQWEYISEYSSNEHWDWRPDAAGEYAIAVFAREVGSAVESHASAKITGYRIDPEPVSSVSVKVDLPPQQLTGTTITWTATAVGGAEPEFQFWSVVDGNWVLERDYSRSPQWAWNPRVPGEYEIVVRSRSVGSVADMQASCRSEPFVIIETQPDANGDGIVNICDLLLVRNSLGKFGSSIDPPALDINRDDVVNVSDLMLIRNRIRLLAADGWAGLPQP